MSSLDMHPLCILLELSGSLNETRQPDMHTLLVIKNDDVNNQKDR